MSLFQCYNCGCAENSALTNGFITSDFYTEMFNWDTALGTRGMQLCSACGPSEYASGGKCRKGGSWHGKFDRVFLPKGEFFTNKQGNLEHIKTGSIDFNSFRIDQ